MSLCETKVSRKDRKGRKEKEINLVLQYADLFFALFAPWRETMKQKCLAKIAKGAKKKR